MENLRLCKNCYFYRKHYEKGEDGELYELPIGRCSHMKVGVMPFRRTLYAGTACGNWQPMEEPEADDLRTVILSHLELIEKALGVK